MTSAIDAVVIPPLTQATVGSWIRAVTGAAILCDADRGEIWGLLGWLLEEREYRDLTGARAWEELEPPARVHDAATTGQMTAYRSQRQAMALLTEKVVASMPKDLLAMHPRYDHTGVLGARAIPLPTLFRWVRTTYNVRASTDVPSLMRQLAAPQGDRSFEELVGAHQTVHAQLGAHGQGINEIAKMQNLLAAASPALREALCRTHTRFLEENPALDRQTWDRAIPLLLNAVRAARDAENYAITPPLRAFALLEDGAGSGSGLTDSAASGDAPSEYAAASIYRLNSSASTVSSPLRGPASFVSTRSITPPPPRTGSPRAQSATRPQGHSSSPSRSPWSSGASSRPSETRSSLSLESRSRSSPSRPSRRLSATSWCATHGVCRHSSAECRTPGPGHAERAQAVARSPH